jgi:membrane-bound lytic murein transglycosylase D
MNKLLLLATGLICLTLEGYTAGIPQEQVGASQPNTIQDSAIKEPVNADPKDGFKDLFEQNSGQNNYTTKLNPKAVDFVEDYMETEGDRLMKMKGWGRPFFDKINTIFDQHNIPVELKYLAVIESDLKSSATSAVGAAGPWQFMPSTAKGLGLHVNRSVDERRDFVKSTNAAARYLSDLYNTYNDWLLVIAAYNGGPGIVNAAIRKSGSRNFWELQNYLPAESRNHVKKFIATHYIMEGDGGLTTLTRNETDALAVPVTYSDPSFTMLNISGKYSALAIAQQIGMDISDFNRLNPNFDRQLSANGKYDLRLTNDKMNLFQANKTQILDQSIRQLLASASSR